MEQFMRKLVLATGATFALFVSIAAADEAANKAVGVEGKSPAGVVNLAPGAIDGAWSPLASRDQSGFGKEIVFTPSAYTPQGIASLERSPLASRDQSGFGGEIVFSPSGYTPEGIGSVELTSAVAAR
jgi:hypothetical protein